MNVIGDFVQLARYAVAALIKMNHMYWYLLRQYIMKYQHRNATLIGAIVKEQVQQKYLAMEQEKQDKDKSQTPIMQTQTIYDVSTQEKEKIALMEKKMEEVEMKTAHLAPKDVKLIDNGLHALESVLYSAEQALSVLSDRVHDNSHGEGQDYASFWGILQAVSIECANMISLRPQCAQMRKWAFEYQPPS